MITVPEESVQMFVKPTIHFTEKELRIIQLIAGNSHKKMFTSTDELNRILGLTNATYDNQKVQRSKLFKSINDKYCNWKNTKEDLIQSRSQQDGDGRYKEYFIAADNLHELETICTKAAQEN